ncbi:hypothetical protein [Flavobacterium sp.]|uniref:hypothetical protein n=1 Tax=Flavobacterium sp. TaxID=239 RepID=UPI002609F40A|nr:hypothetical protein [Flavobacterium sp.]
MKEVYFAIILSSFFSCATNNFNGEYKNQYGHILTINDSTFKYISYDGANGEYYSYGKIIYKSDSIVLVSGRIHENFFNIIELDTIKMKIISKNKFVNKEYKFKRY